MNTNRNEMPVDDCRFDRLVDGELSEAERRQMLTGLDDEPGGWRRCALAFLESQCWKQTFGGIAREPAADHGRPTPRRRIASRWTRPLGTFLAVAASFVLAFWVGSLMKQSQHDGSIVPSGGTEIASTTGAAPVAKPATNPWHMVKVSEPTGSSLEVPAVERANIDPEWLQKLPPAMPENVMQAFNRAGHQVEQHRELVPVPLQDGRRLVVPVDQVDVHYVGNNTY